MNFVHRLLTQHIDIWTAADTGPKSGRGRSSSSGGSVYGVKKLRELILELAMRGKLLPQDPNDEPASELLKRVHAEKAKLIAEGVIRKDKPLPPITEDEIPFKLPPGWSHERLGNLAHLITKGTTPTSIGFSYQSAGIRFVKVENVSAGRINLKSIDQYLSDEADEALSRSRLMPSDVLFSIAGTIGRTCIIHSEDIPANTNQAFAIIRGTRTAFDQMFLLRQLDSFVSNKTKERARGGAMYNVSLADLAELVLIIPSIAEQHRIVAKVDEMMALCDQLEAQHINAVDAHEKLVSHLLGTLTQSQNAEDFSANWQRIATHFDTLFITEASIDALKQTLLQLAVMGKLVPQDPTDEPASELLKQVRAEKSKLIAEGRIKKERRLPSLADDNRPFDLPMGWTWARFPDLGEFGRGKSKHRPRNDPQLFKPGIYPLVQTGEVARANNIIDECHSKYSDIGLAQSKLWPAGTLCITIAANIADSALLGFDSCFPDSVVGFVPCKPLNSARYLLTFMKTARKNLLSFAPATAQKNINLEILESVLIPVPPLKEITRIVSKVDELMTICDQLKNRIDGANQLQKKLADVMVEYAVARPTANTSIQLKEKFPELAA